MDSEYIKWKTMQFEIDLFNLENKFSTQ